MIRLHCLEDHPGNPPLRRWDQVKNSCSCLFFEALRKNPFVTASIINLYCSDWLYPMTDSPYDSLEKELDNISSSPSFSNRRHLRAETLQGSLDSILTFSDTDPEILRAQAGSEHRLKVQPLARHRARRLKAGVSYVSRDTQAVSSDSRERRCSEPAITSAAKFGPCVSGRESENSEELSSQPANHKNSRDESRKSGVKSAGLEASPPSSLSSISPDPTRSSLNSPDSLDSDVTWERRRGFYITRTHLTSTSATVSSPHTSSRLAEHHSCPKGSQLKEPLNWGTLKSCHSLHPNSWLKKGRRLSLTQQDNLAQEEDKSGVSHTDLPHRVINVAVHMDTPDGAQALAVV